MLQSQALELLKLGHNIFLTGAAGSGKTHVLSEYIDYLKSHAVDVAVTASTGIAATHIGGMTIHSWSGLGIRSTLTDYDIEDLMERQYLYKRFERTKVLIIDEVSMLHSFRFDLIEWICRQMKRSEKPFGGMQIIVCGDFFQLPPVTAGESDSHDFAYKALSWEDAKLTICYLSEQHRQKDNTYLSILNQIRDNTVSSSTIDTLRSRLFKDVGVEGESTKLFTHNIDVDKINHQYLGLIKSPVREFQMSWKGSTPLAEALKKSCLSPETLQLKKGARVMFTKNHPEGRYVNGTLGLVKEFNSFGDPIIETHSGVEFHVSPQSWKIEEEGKTKAEITQLPLRLAWAITVHKSQGMSLDAMEVDLSKSFVKGMGYVALSRVRSLEGMKLLGFNEMSLQVHPEVLKMDKTFREKSGKAVEYLKSLSRQEIAEKQKEYLKEIEPEEKVRIKKKERELKKSTEEITGDLLMNELSLDEIAHARGLKQETIISHIEDLQQKGKCPDIDYLKKELKKTEFHDIMQAFKKTGTTTLSPVYNLLLKEKKKPTYVKIRLGRLFLER